MYVAQIQLCFSLEMTITVKEFLDFFLCTLENTPKVDIPLIHFRTRTTILFTRAAGKKILIFREGWRSFRIKTPNYA